LEDLGVTESAVAAVASMLSTSMRAIHQPNSLFFLKLIDLDAAGIESSAELDVGSS
jgi:hypothetical protein